MVRHPPPRPQPSSKAGKVKRSFSSALFGGVIAIFLVAAVFFASNLYFTTGTNQATRSLSEASSEGRDVVSSVSRSDTVSPQKAKKAKPSPFQPFEVVAEYNHDGEAFT